MDRTYAIALLVLAAALLMGAAGALGDVEPNDDIGTAEPIGPGTHAGNVTVVADEDDWYSFSITAGQVIRVGLTADTAELPVRCTLMTSATHAAVDPVVLRSMDDETDSASLATARETTSLEWLLNVNSTGENGSYELTLELVDPNDAGTGVDAPGDLANATTIGPGEHAGMLGDMDTADCYRLELRRGWLLDIELNVTGAEAVTLKVTKGIGGETIATLTSDSGVADTFNWEVPDDPNPAVDCFLLAEGDIHGDDEEERGVYVLTVAIDKDANPQDDVLPTIGAEPTVDAREGEDLRLVVAITDNVNVSRARLHYRAGGEGNWSSVAMTRDGDEWSAVVPKGELEGASNVQYYVEAEDMWGNEVTYGSEASPKSVEMEEAEDDDSPGVGALVAILALVAVAAMVRTVRR